MSQGNYEIGLIGLGVMGRNLLLNVADHGYSAAGFNRDPSKVQAFLTESQGKQTFGTSNLAEFVSALRQPRAIILLVSAGAAVDAVLNELCPLLSPGDLVIDGGNSHFRDTDRRIQSVTAKGLHFFGMGVSGGEEGARFGPSIMPGGPKDAFERVRPVLEAISAKVNGEPCVAYMGAGSAGHYVKMVHNGIEYGQMQMLAEVYDVMRRVLKLSNDEMGATFAEWNRGELASFLVEITSEVFYKVDEKTGKRLLDMVKDVARQKGTGKWTSQDALDLGMPLSTIDVAVTSRYLSSLEQERIAAGSILKGPEGVQFTGDKQVALMQLRHAYHAGMILAYAQGMALLRKAGNEYKYGLDLEAVARIWRGGCIIRSALLEDMRKAYKANPDLANLLLDPNVATTVNQTQAGLRATVQLAAAHGVSVATLSAALAYLDAYRCTTLPANLTQAQRDYFGAHTYERIDEPGIFHSHWAKTN